MMLHPSPVRRPLLLLAVLAAAGLAGCAAPAQLVDLWRDPEYSARPMTRVFVVALKRDEARRRLWEDGFVRELARRGVAATPSYRDFPQAFPDTAQVVEAVHQGGYDGVIVTVKLPTETQHTYVPGYVASEPVTRYNPWWATYRTYWVEVYRPGYVETEKVVRHRTDVWSTAGEKGHLVWTGTSEVFDPTSSQAVNHYIVTLVVPELAKQGIITKR